MFDVVSVYHRDAAYNDFRVLAAQIEQFETDVPYTLIGVDNRIKNVGFAKGCNQGAAQGDAPYLAFLNPDSVVYGPFMQRVIDVFDTDPNVVITGCRFGKSDRELRIWGCRDWVCGAAMMVRRTFWEQVGGFDEQFVWGFEESDLIRQAQQLGRQVKSIEFPIFHQSPDQDTPEDARYKQKWFTVGAERFYTKWRPSRRTR